MDQKLVGYKVNEQWTRWEPFPYSNRTCYYIEQMTINKKGLIIILVEYASEINAVQVVFKNSVVAYTSTDESFVIDTLSYLDENYGDHFYGTWPFFKITNSKYIQRLSDRLKSHSKDASTLIHFVLLTGNSTVDVIANYEPEVTLITRNIRTLMLLNKEHILPIIIKYIPNAKIILYGPRSRGENPTEKYSTIPIQIALDAGYTIDPLVIRQVEEFLDDDSGVRISCNIVDLHAVSQDLRQQILQEGIDWVKAKNI